MLVCWAVIVAGDCAPVPRLHLCQHYGIGISDLSRQPWSHNNRSHCLGMYTLDRYEPCLFNAPPGSAAGAPSVVSLGNRTPNNSSGVPTMRDRQREITEDEIVVEEPLTHWPNQDSLHRKLCSNISRWISLYQYRCSVTLHLFSRYLRRMGGHHFNWGVLFLLLPLSSCQFERWPGYTAIFIEKLQRAER